MSHSGISAVCFGEILWDLLPDGAVPGGAPMNVAYHLNKLGGQAGIISRLGHDAAGDALMAFLENQAVPVGGIQRDAIYPTGKVLATPGPNYEMQYDIVFPVAWDFIQATPMALEQSAAAQYFIFGSLAVRHNPSWKALQRLLPQAQTKVLDINLRPPHFTRDHVEALLRWANFLKLNDHELELVSGWYEVPGSQEDRARSLCQRFEITQMVITRGAAGAACFLEDHFYEHPGFEVTVADTVGSGDGFLAGFLTQWHAGKTPAQSLEFACKLGAFIASQKGACPNYSMQDLTNV